MRGYKAFDKDWTCREFRYKIGETYSMNEKPMLCNFGFHFCESLNDCFEFYPFDSEKTNVAEVEAIGDIDRSEKKCCTNQVHIIREVPWDEVLRIINSGKECTGRCNTGDWNTGDWNTGDCNTGDWNTGNRNTGNRNTGDCNTGNRNTGDWNTGDWNTGDWNTGNRNTGDWNTGNRNTGNCNTGNRNTGNCNTGDWNTGDWNTGCFNTTKQKIMMFDKQSDWTIRDWYESRAYSLMRNIPRNVLTWVWSSDMSDEEKEAHPEYKCTEGYLKRLDESGSAQVWWDSLVKSDRDEIQSLPNFDASIFEQCTGIKIGDKNE